MISWPNGMGVGYKDTRRTHHHAGSQRISCGMPEGGPRGDDYILWARGVDDVTCKQCLAHLARQQARLRTMLDALLEPMAGLASETQVLYAMLPTRPPAPRSPASTTKESVTAFADRATAWIDANCPAGTKYLLIASEVCDHGNVCGQYSFRGTASTIMAVQLMVLVMQTIINGGR